MKKFLSVCCGLALFAGSAVAEEVDADAFIKYRVNLMENARNHSRGISAILKGKVNMQGDIARHARALHEVSMMVPAAFPEGSDFGETNAKEKIWEEWDRFLAAAEKNQVAIAALVKAAEGGDMGAIKAAVKDVGESCKSCHKAYRIKK